VEVARAHLDRIERLNPKLNAFVDYQPEVVLAQARDAEKAILRRDKDKDDLDRCMVCRFPSSLRLTLPDIAVKPALACAPDTLLLRMRRWWRVCVRPEP